MHRRPQQHQSCSISSPGNGKLSWTSLWLWIRLCISVRICTSPVLVNCPRRIDRLRGEVGTTDLQKSTVIIGGWDGRVENRCTGVKYRWENHNTFHGAFSYTVRFNSGIVVECQSIHEEFEFSPKTWIDTRIMSGSTLDVKIHAKQHMQNPCGDPCRQQPKGFVVEL